jgi:hypothetical protein
MPSHRNATGEEVVKNISIPSFHSNVCSFANIVLAYRDIMVKVKIEPFCGILYSLSAQFNISLLRCPLRLFERPYQICPPLYIATKSLDGATYNATEIVVQLLNPLYSFLWYWVAGAKP